MQKPAATLETGGQRDRQQDAAPEPARSPGGGAMKFVHTSGSRPLNGFTIKRGIGVGGFGEVYFAVSDAGKEVALKRIQRNLEVEVRGVTQCLNLKHINLIALYDVRYDDDGGAWVVMEFVAGETLREILDRYPQGMSVAEALRLFRGIASGVGYLHDHGIVHRDLKPGNIFYDDDTVKIGDYGLSKFISCSRRSGQTESVGTFHYMAPEIGKGVYGKEIDIYALGVMLYEMVTGRVPFDGESSQEIIMKHLTADPEVNDVPEPFRTVVRRALRKDPEQRYSSVAEMVAALETPPVRIANEQEPIVAAVTGDTVASDVMYIGPDGSSEGDMVFGPVRENAESGTVGRVHRRAAAGSMALDSEPIARTVRSSCDNVRQRWNNSKLSTAVKMALLITGLIIVILNSEWLVPVALVLAVPYVIYLAVRALVRSVAVTPANAVPPIPAEPHRSAVAAAAPQAAASATVAHPPTTTPASVRTATKLHKSRQAALRAALARQPLSQHTADLLGAMLTAAIVVAVLGLVILTAGGRSTVETWSYYAWLAIVSTTVSWSVLTLSKYWQRHDVDEVWRRFTLLAVGMAAGAGAFALQHVLMLDFGASNIGAFSIHDVPAAMFGNGRPLLPAYLLYFAGLLVALRWWKQADPLRSSRLSLVATGVCLFVAWMLPFPEPLGIMTAATTSLAVQMSAPWLSQARRAELGKQTQENLV